MKTQQQLEDEFIRIRSGLRVLRGELDSFSMAAPHGSVDGFESSASRNAKCMRRLVDMCITYMDRYDDQRELHGQLESMTERLHMLTGKGGAHAER